MTRTFTYTFDRIVKDNNGEWKNEQITLKKRVTDKMEERNGFKAGYAAHFFNEVLRTEYGYHTSPVTGARVQEV